MSKLIECKRKDLLAALDIVMPVIETRNTIPILANVLIRANGSKIMIEGTDLDVNIRHDGIARIGNDKSNVAITVQAKSLYEFVKAAGGDDLYMKPDFEQKIASFNAGAARSTSILPVDDFPTLSDSETPARFDISIGDMLILIKTIKPAISTEETRYYLNGMFFEPLGNNKMSVTATDGHRLHNMTVKANGIRAINAKTKVIVPTKTISVVQKWMTRWLKSNGTDTLFVEMGNKHINFRCGTVTVRSKLIDGTFPDWHRVVPRTEGEVFNDKVATLDSAALDKILKVVSKLSTESHPRATKFSFTKNKIELSMTDPDNGKISDTMECVYDSAPLEIGFNGKYVREAIAALSGQNIELVMADAGSPTLCRKVGEANPFCVLMPMRF